MKLKELAKHLRLSPTTVSRALNGYPEVNEKTRERVQKAAKKWGYAPSHQARNLATGRSATIGHLLPSANHQMINPHFADFFHGASKAYASAGYDSLLRMVSEENEQQSYHDLARSNRVDGFIVHGPRVDDSRISFLQKLNFPFLVHGRCGNVPETSYSWLDVNNTHSFRRATKFLMDLGHINIALLNGLEWMNFAKQRREGYEQALLEQNISVDERLCFSQDMTEPYGYDATKELLQQKTPATALVCSSIIPALGAQRALQETGLCLGKDFSIVIFDDQLSAMPNSGNIPMFTSVRSSISSAGFTASTMLLEMIANKNHQHFHQLWEADLIIGRSTAPPKR